MAKLVVISQTPAGLSHELGTRWVTIGRANGNAFQVVEQSVSEQHCEVRLRGDELTVRDLRSTNGTFINEVMISEGVLKAGETLRLGSVELRLEMSAPVAAPPQVESPAKPEREPADKAVKKFQVLMVDDSMAFLEMMSGLFEDLAGQTWKIYTASAADQALDILEQNPIALVVLDIGMPMLDGVQLLGIINKRFPGVKKVMLTGSAGESSRADSLANGAELFLEKPLTPDGIKFVFNVLNDLLSWTHREGFSGTLKQVALPDVIQIQCLGRNSYILGVRNERTSGEIYIETGAIVHATAGDLSGVKAFHHLLALTNGEFHLQPFKEPAARTVHEPWELLLMEAARAHDEEKHLAANADTVIIAKSLPATRPAPASENPPAPNTVAIEPPPPANTPDTEFIALGDDIIVVSTDGDDGEWRPENEPQN
jgi:CheY-like chemotaxis protein